MTKSTQKIRTVAGIINSIETMEGDGFLVRRPFPKSSFADFDPFLLLDEMGPIDLGPGQATGAPAHPHRGFETVTYLLAGRMEHKDSQGHAGTLGPGDVQWMTAGAGVVHSEMPEREFARQGGRLHGFQLWVNLPKRDKMIPPRYQDLPAEKIPTVQSADGLAAVKVIAGEAFGVRTVIATRTPILYLHFTLQPGAQVLQPVPPEYNAFAYLIDGEGEFGADKKHANDGQMVLFSQDGGEIAIVAAQDTRTPLNLLLIAGMPLNEPVVRYGPFVMNTEEEIDQAMNDFRGGRMGQIDF